MKTFRNATAVMSALVFLACNSGYEDADLLGENAQALTVNGVTAVVKIQSDWTSGYCADVTITNPTSAAIQNWKVQLDLRQSTINNLWNGTASGASVTPAGHNGTVNAGQSVNFGFCANAPGPDYKPIVSGLTFDGGGGSSSGGTSSGGTSSGGTSSGGTNSGGTNSGGTSSGGTSSGGTAGNGSYPPIQTGCNGYATRFWDCCKPHCGWPNNVPSGVTAMNSCSSSNQTLSSKDTQSACNGGGAHTCYGLTPVEINSTLSFGYAATSSGDVCGRCYQLDFTGSSHNSPGDPGSARLAGKKMIVQAINIGYDVNGGQFDLLIPGGGVGAFNACSAQWGVSNSDLGAQYGGFLSACKSQLGYNATSSQYKSCVANKCDTVFGSRGLTDLAQGCHWFAGWFEAADNPSLKYKEVACPTDLSSETGMNRGSLSISQACGQ